MLGTSHLVCQRGESCPGGFRGVIPARCQCVDPWDAHACVCVCVCAHAQSLSCVWLFATPWMAVCQAPPSIRFSRQEYWNGLPFPSPGDLPDPGTEPMSSACPALAGRFSTTVPPGKPPSKWSKFFFLKITLHFTLLNKRVDKLRMDVCLILYEVLRRGKELHVLCGPASYVWWLLPGQEQRIKLMFGLLCFVPSGIVMRSNEVERRLEVILLRTTIDAKL